MEAFFLPSFERLLRNTHPNDTHHVPLRRQAKQCHQQTTPLPNAPPALFSARWKKRAKTSRKRPASTWRRRTRFESNCDKPRTTVTGQGDDDGPARMHLPPYRLPRTGSVSTSGLAWNTEHCMHAYQLPQQHQAGTSVFAVRARRMTYFLYILPLKGK